MGQVADPGGFEPPASRLTVERSNHAELWVHLRLLKTFSRSTDDGGNRTNDYWLKEKFKDLIMSIYPRTGLNRRPPLYKNGALTN